jgi:dCMP deaminase
MNKDFLTNIYQLVQTTKSRLNWNDYFMSIAILSSQRSSCNRLKVGCVIVKSNRIICMGYNGLPSGGPHTSRIINNHEQCTIHAEQNAISDAASRGVCIADSIIYITHFPCINCFKSIIAAKIKQIYYCYDYKNNNIVIEMAKENNIIIKKI